MATSDCDGSGLVHAPAASACAGWLRVRGDEADACLSFPPETAQQTGAAVNSSAYDSCRCCCPWPSSSTASGHARVSELKRALCGCVAAASRGCAGATLCCILRPSAIAKLLRLESANAVRVAAPVDLQQMKRNATNFQHSSEVRKGLSSDPSGLSLRAARCLIPEPVQCSLRQRGPVVSQAHATSYMCTMTCTTAFHSRIPVASIVQLSWEAVTVFAGLCTNLNNIKRKGGLAPLPAQQLWSIP